MYDGDTFTHKGAEFRVSIEPDQHHGAPNEENDGHGVVGKWSRRDYIDPPRGFWRLVLDRHFERLYDWRETVKIAKRDGWGLGEEDRAKLAKRLGRVPTEREVIHEAVRRDFEYLRGFYEGEWNYVVIGVRQVGTTEKEYLGGVESFCKDYIAECARDLAEEILHRTNAAKEEDMAHD